MTPLSVDDYLGRVSHLWFTDFEKVEGADEKYLLISSTLIIGSSSCRVMYLDNKLTGEIGCLRQTPIWVLDDI